MREGSVFRRCGKCGARMPERRCGKCGSDSFAWAFVVDVAPPGAKREQKMKGGFATKAAAIAARNELQAAHATGSYVAPIKLTVGQYLEEWLPGVRGEVRASTYGTYELAVRRLVPLIGGLPLQALTFAQVKAAYRQLTESGGSSRRRAGSEAEARPLSAKTVHNVHLALRRALRDAVRGQLVSHNAAEAGHRLASDSRPEMLTWTVDELREFLDAVAEHPLFPLLRLAANTGMRRGELLGLRWKDVDLGRSRLGVRQQLSRQGERIVFGPVKTKAGRRSIALDPITVAALRTLRDERTVIVAQFGDAYPTDDLVFARADGSRLDPDVVSQTFETLVRRAKLRRIRFHDLRHTHATLALQAGIHPKVVQERLGHSSITVTLDLYSHAIPAMQEDAAARIAAIVDRPLDIREHSVSRTKEGQPLG